MYNSLFYCGVDKNSLNSDLIEMLDRYSDERSKQIYVIDAPMGADYAERYEYKDTIIVLIPKHKICVINLSDVSSEEFENFYDDFIEDLGYLSDKFDYRKELGRPREWKEKLIFSVNKKEVSTVKNIFINASLDNPIEQRNADFLISLLTGSINDVSRIGGGYPETLLDQVKKKIILFDGDQSRFIYSKVVQRKRVTIQGLAGTGKTELLLHKLKDLYLRDKDSRIIFTCFNKILAQSMKKRVPEFFNFMRVEEQIKWEERLWVMSSWGSKGQSNTGVYSYVCSNYGLEFHSYSYGWQFEKVCDDAIDELKRLDSITPCFDYILIDESQDFPQSFFDLCEMVTKHIVYIAGDIFQDIYDRTLTQSVHSDYLLNKCYRTDPRTLMFAHAVGMGLYENPVIRWLDDDEWIACGYKINRDNYQFSLSRIPLRRFEDLDTSGVSSIEIEPGDSGNTVHRIFNIIDKIKAEHSTVRAGDIAIVFLEGSKANYNLADYLALKIPQKYGWSAAKGYETKESNGDTVFISNRNNVKGLEFPFVICVTQGKIQNDVFTRNTIYMMLTRSFITSYFLLNSELNSDFITIYTKAAKEISKNSIMVLREPSEKEKKQQNQKVSIATSKKQRSLKDIVEEVILEYPKLSTKKKNLIINNMTEIIEDEREMSETEIQDRTKKLISALI